MLMLSIPPEELDKSVERVLEARTPAVSIKELGEVEMHKPRNKAEAAAFLGIKPRQLEVWMRKPGAPGGLGCPYYKPAHIVKFTYATLAEWLEKFRVN